MDLAADYVGRALAQRTVDFMAEVANIVPITVISRLIGFRNSDVDRLLRAAFDSTEMIGVTLSRERLLELMTRSNDLGAWIADQMAIAANEPGEDILTPSDAAWKAERSVPPQASSSCKSCWPPEVSPRRA